MNNRILVFAKHKEKGIEFLDSLIGEIKYKYINKIRKNSIDYFIELKDGTSYLLVPASDCSRGYKCNKAYVENDVGEEIIDCVIKPTLIMSNLSSEEQIEFF